MLGRSPGVNLPSQPYKQKQFFCCFRVDQFSAVFFYFRVRAARFFAPPPRRRHGRWRQTWPGSLVPNTVGRTGTKLMAAKAPLQIRERLAAAVRKYKFRVVCGRGVGQTPPAVDRNAAGCYQPRLWRPTLCCVAGCCAVGLQFLAAPSRWFRVGPPGPPFEPTRPRMVVVEMVVVVMAPSPPPAGPPPSPLKPLGLFASRGARSAPKVIRQKCRMMLLAT